jgi:hypothetical protein
VVCAIALVVGLSGLGRREYDAFVGGNVLPGYAQPRDRLTSVGADGRVPLWRVAVDQFDEAPLHGAGAQTFELAWELRRPRYEQVQNAHSLYLENLGELGIVGLGLLAAVIVASLVGIARRLRGPERPIYAAAFAAALTWTIHAGLDWDWQMPVVTLPVFALAGAALAMFTPTGEARLAESAPTGEGGLARSNPTGEAGRAGSEPAACLDEDLSGRAAPGRSRAIRAAVGLAGVGVAVVMWLAASSESHVQSSVDAFTLGDCAKAAPDAQASLSVLSFRPDAHEILAYCEAADGRPNSALRNITRAVNEDPDNWETHYGLAVVEGEAGADPRRQMARALALDPKDQVIELGTETFAYRLRRYWRADARLDVLEVAGQGNQTLENLRPPPALGPLGLIG